MHNCEQNKAHGCNMGSYAISNACLFMLSNLCTHLFSIDALV